MKALTMRRPWAELLVNGRKIRESRKGPVLNRHRGQLAIHVSQKSPGWERDAERLRYQFGLSDEDFAVPFPIDGCVIGTVMAGRTFKFIRPYSAMVLSRYQNEAVYADIEKRYLTALTRARWLEAPVPAKGRQSMWEWTTCQN